MTPTLWDWIVVLLLMHVPLAILTAILRARERAERRRRWRRYGVEPRPLRHESTQARVDAFIRQRYTRE